jgi:hypothetical protein
MAPLGVSGNQKWLENPWKSPIDGNLNGKIIHKNGGFSSHAMRTRYCRSGTPGFTMERNPRPSREMTWGFTQHVPLIAVNPPSSPWPALGFFTRHCWASCPTCKPVAAQTNLKPEETAEKPDFPLDFFWEIVVQIIVLGLWNYVSRWTIGGPSVRSTGTANSNVTFGYWSHRLQPANTKRPNFGSPENWGAWSEPWNWSTNWSGKTQTKTLYTKNPKFTPRISWIRTKINHVYGDNLII